MAGQVGFDSHDGLTRFFAPRQAGKGSILQETFLVADIRVEVVLGMPFLTLSSADIRFAEVLVFGGLFRSLTSRERFDSSGDLSGGRHQSGSGPGDAFPHHQQCKHTVCRGACLENLHGCRRPSGWNSSIQKNFRLRP